MAPRRVVAPPPPPAPLHAVERLAELAAWLLVLAVPMAWDVAAASPFRGPKTALALAAWITLAGIFAAASRPSAWRDPWMLPWAGVLAAGAVSAAASAQPLRAAASLVGVVLACFGVMALRLLPEARRVRLRALVVIAGVVQAVLVLAFRTPALRPASFRALEDATGRFAIVGTIGNPGDVAMFLALPALLAAALAVEAPRRRALWACAALFMAAVTVSTATVTVVAALGVGLALLFAARLPRRLRRAALAALLVGGVVAVTVGPLAQRLDTAVTQLRAGDWLWFGSGRAVSFAAALAMVAARPLTGVGFGLYGAESFRFQSEDALATRGRILDLVTGFGEAHSDPLQFLAETGILGVLLLLAGCWLAFRRGARLGGVLPAVLPLAVTALLVAAAQFPLHLTAVAAQWLVLGALALPPLEAAAMGGRAGWLRLAAVLLIAAAGTTMAWHRHRALRAIRAAESMVVAIRAGSLGPSGPSLAAVALPRLEQHLRWLPFSAPGEIAAGNLAIEARRPEVALAHFQRALALGERPEARFDIGMTLLLMGEREGGFGHLMRAVKLNPAVLKRVEDPVLARELRRRLDLDGYGRRYPWIWAETLAADP